MRTFSGETVFLRIGGRVESGRDTEKLENILKAFGSGEYREVVIDVGGVACFCEEALDLLVDAVGRSKAIRVKGSTQQIRDAIRAKIPAASKIFSEDESTLRAA
jgi:anti-anti-sigma regulatory factor